MANDLVQIVQRYTETHDGGSPFATPIDGVAILRNDDENHTSHIIFQPALCVVVQGAKWSTFGDKRLEYRAGQALVVSVDLPGFSEIAEASPAHPYLAVVIEFDPAIMRDIMEALSAPPKLEGKAPRGVFVADFEGPLSDCVLRMMRLLEKPDAIPVLAPMIMREISYWLLTGPHGGDVAKVVLGTPYVENIVKAIHVMREKFAETLRVEDLAEIAQMSPSAFHRQFKALTSMSPLQYQKQLRLVEARNLMLSGAANAETAAFKVGYESASQFSREYARMFGAPPRRDMLSLRTA